jgi:hypothetical protein
MSDLLRRYNTPSSHIANCLCMFMYLK